MRIRLLTIGHKPPEWIKLGFDEYKKRLPSSCTLELIEIAPPKGSSIEREGDKLLAAIKPQSHVIALDIKGKLWSSEQLAVEISRWQQDSRTIDLLIGGAEGLSTKCLQKAEDIWSLSSLTFPHMMVRVIIAEQIYRALSIIQGHPYHK